MCGVYGFIVTKEAKVGLNRKRKLVRALGIQAQKRGSDATGIAFTAGNRLWVRKSPVPAKQFPFHKSIPEEARAIIGHTRAATQGAASNNKNNHPFSGKVKTGKRFVFAHNGIIWNDFRLRRELNLEEPKIETDSYIVAQLLEQEKAINFPTLKKVAEKLEGSFVLTFLLDNNDMYWVVHDNPLVIAWFKELGMIVYASTQEILEKALKKDRALYKYYVTMKEGKNTTCLEIATGVDGRIIHFDYSRNCFSYASFQPKINYYYYGWANYNTKYDYCTGGGYYSKYDDVDGYYDDTLYLPPGSVKPKTSFLFSDTQIANKKRTLEKAATFYLTNDVNDLEEMAYVEIPPGFIGDIIVTGTQRLKSAGYKVVEAALPSLEAYDEWEEMFISFGLDAAMDAAPKLWAYYIEKEEIQWT